MSTRGLLGFVSGGRETMTYNHYDSYPDGLGCDVLVWLRGLNPDQFTQAKIDAQGIVHVSEEGAPPAPEDVERLKQFADLNVGERHETPDWYQLLRKTQGSPGAILDAGYALHNPQWPLDSLFCEYGYVVDFDRNVFEAYKGFRESPTVEGRWAGQLSQPGHRSDKYYPISLVAEWPLDSLPTDEELSAAFGEGDQDE